MNKHYEKSSKLSNLMNNLEQSIFSQCLLKHLLKTTQMLESDISQKLTLLRKVSVIEQMQDSSQIMAMIYQTGI